MQYFQFSVKSMLLYIEYINKVGFFKYFKLQYRVSFKFKHTRSVSYPIF